MLADFLNCVLFFIYEYTMLKIIVVLVVSLQCFALISDAAKCQIVPPLDGTAASPEYGMIFIPAPEVDGEEYR